jgi:tripartite ATP-independent transporter DctP family solute receptor
MKPVRLLLAAAAVLFAASALAQTELRFGHVGGPTSLFEISAQHFAKLANERLGGKYKVVVYHSSQLGNDTELLQRLRLGTVDFALPSTVMSSVADEFGMFELPYLVKSREHMQRIEKEIFWPSMAPLLKQKGFTVLAVWENGFRHITNNVRPIVRPADLKGIKLRTPMGVWRVRMFEAYGAHPSPMAYSEVFTALQTGVMDGQENPLPQITGGRFQEVQKFLSMSGHVYTPAYVTAGANFAKLPADVQKILTQAARDTQAHVYKEAARLDNELIAVIKSAGTSVNEVDKDAFIKASQAVYDLFAEKVPGAREMVKRAIALGAGL